MSEDKIDLAVRIAKNETCLYYHQDHKFEVEEPDWTFAPDFIESLVDSVIVELEKRGLVINKQEGE